MLQMERRKNSDRSNKRKSIRDEDQNNRERVVLLLDLDCFYAQVEAIRLGLDCAVLPIALLQWSSALAVNYPARAMGIKRGDDFSTIMSKSERRCIVFHLPVIPIEGLEEASPSDEQEPSSAVSLDDDYDKVFKLSRDERDDIFERERNWMRRPHEGKASLERCE